MDVAVAQELRLCHAASVTESMLAGDADRRFNAEAYQRVLWRHRAEIIRMIEDQEETTELISAMRQALRPFGRCAEVLAAGHNPVLISLPSPADDGRTFVQLRPAHFRRAASLLERSA